MNLNGFLSMTGNISGNLGSDLVVEVEANPSGVATEPLIKLRVGNVIYAIPSGGGGGGTSDYNMLTNKPKINGIILQDELSLHSLGIQEEITFSGEATEYLNGEGYFSTPPVYIPINYSTTEQKTGQKWIDGKDIYVKVMYSVTQVQLTNTEWKNIPWVEEPTDIDLLISATLTGNVPNNFYNLRFSVINGRICGASKSEGPFPTSNNPDYVIFQYTKITD